MIRTSIGRLQLLTRCADRDSCGVAGRGRGYYRSGGGGTVVGAMGGDGGGTCSDVGRCDGGLVKQNHFVERKVSLCESVIISCNH